MKKIDIDADWLWEIAGWITCPPQYDGMDKIPSLITDPITNQIRPMERTDREKILIGFGYVKDSNENWVRK